MKDIVSRLREEAPKAKKLAPLMREAANEISLLRNQVNGFAFDVLEKRWKPREVKK